MKRNDIIKIFFLLIVVCVFLPCTFVEGAMTDYCIVPPFVSQSIPPNVMILLDNSGSMCGQAYAGSYDPTQFDKICSDEPSKRCDTAADCSSGVCDSYYYGYFEGPKKYRYSGRWEETTDAMTTGTVANPVATGSFLNWATMRRDEVAKRLLIGGKANPRSWNGSVTVKLDGETACGFSADYDMEKDHDTSAGDLIYPFVGPYRFTRADNSQGLYIAPIGGATETEIRRPNSDIANGAWIPNSGTTRYTQVDEVSADTTTYIENKTSSTNDQVIMGYDKSAFSIAGVITGVTVVVRAKKSSSVTMRVQGVIRVKDGSGGDTDFVSSYSNLSTSYSTYNFSFPTNPQSGAAWTFNDLTTSGALSLTGFGVKAYTTPNSTKYPTVTQMYLIVTVTNPTGGPFNTIVDMGPGKDAKGIIDSLTNDVRFGLAYYAGASKDGARVEIDVDFATPTNMITSIHNQTPSTYTPLGESLYELARYFGQEPPYYSNSPADYSTGLNYDPYYFDYPDASITDSYVYCAKSYVLMLTDGESTNDQNMPGSGSGACSLTNIEQCSSAYRFAGTAPAPVTYPTSGTDFLVDVAFWARTNDLRPGACTDTPTVWQKCLPGMQNLTLYPVFMFGRGSTLLKDAAIDGGFLDLDGDNRPDCLTSPKECYRDSDGDGVVESNGEDFPLTYYEGNDGYALEKSIIEAINAILKRASSGTAASVLASGEGSGANIVQAIFYPKRTFVDTEIDWTATLQNLWYFIDPNLGTSSIREDTDQEYELELEKDSIVHFTFSASEQKTKARLYASDTRGNQGSLLSEVYVEDLKYLWEAGSLLHSRLIASDPRTIYTTTDGSARITFDSSLATATTLQTYLQASSPADAQNIIKYVRGDTDVDTALYRSRTVTNGATTGIWRLGDIVNSTPRLVSHIPLHTYDEKYDDESYKNFTDSPKYTNRGMVMVGGNDGMLHAIRLGNLETVNNSTSKKAILSGSDRGEEEWAFIPKSALPYLKYMMEKDYCHLYYIDATPYVFDASVGKGPGDVSNTLRDECKPYNEATCPWRTILIGGMRLGGACKATTYAGSNGVKVPVAGKGYSSYFALDITNPEVPELLWEFNDPELGFSTSGPAIIRINARNVDGSSSVADDKKNGKWFVVFASGPTGPIDIASHQFKGYSDQPLKLFVFDVKAGPGIGNANVLPINTGIPYAFGGLLNNGNMDYDRDYQDDVLYLGYTKSEDAVPDADTRWTQGGVIRLITREDLSGANESGTALNPGNWLWSYVAKDIGSVTSAVGHLAHYPYDDARNPDAAFVYFGSGRYFYKTSEIDNANIQRSLFGIKEPCLSKLTKPITELTDPVCGAGDLADDGSHSLIGNATATSTTDPDGWYINLDMSSGLSCAERVITDPLATTLGAVFFTTYAPNTDLCTYGGSTYLWGLKYNTGGTVNGLLQGVALLQVSTGSIEELNLSTAFVEKGEGGDAAKGRRTAARIGAPPTGQGLSILTNPPPVKRVLNIRER